jgi:hypothetical protein
MSPASAAHSVKCCAPRPPRTKIPPNPLSLSSFLLLFPPPVFPNAQLFTKAESIYGFFGTKHPVPGGGRVKCVPRSDHCA